MSGLRQDWYYEQTEKLEVCESRLEAIEVDMTVIKSEADNIEDAKRSAGMKLELGF